MKTHVWGHYRGGAASPAARAKNYLAKLLPAIAGQGGHNATYRAACVLVEFGLSWADAWPLFVEWNGTHCRPAWSELELHHKLADAYRLTQPREEFRQRSASRTGQNTFSGPGVIPPPPPPPPSGGRSQLAAEDEPGAGESDGPKIPPLRTGSFEECSLLGWLRRLPVPAACLASERGLVAFGEYMGHKAWFVTDKANVTASARRLDGKEWADGVKAWLLKGSAGNWPVGILEALPYRRIYLVEGGGDLLAACSRIDRLGESDVAPVAMLSASMRIHERALPLFAGKRVEIFAQADTAGRAAAKRWAGQLESSSIVVVHDIGTAAKMEGWWLCKDLNDYETRKTAATPRA